MDTWIQRNKIVFKNDKCNHYFVLELAKKIIIRPWSIKCNNLPNFLKSAGSNDAGKKYIQQN